MKCECNICEVEGDFVESTDLTCLSCYDKLLITLKGIVGLIGNVDHSKGNGANSAKMRGDMLNDIRAIVKPVLDGIDR